ncbi:MAG TPA: tetratricopeptide repeat protein [Candidatus Deferrimicrobium sp.]|nr:tetratricopeptide repeat protein [Candidatus Deferrimicrobium sp.]
MLNRDKAMEFGITLLIILSLATASLYGYYNTKPTKPLTTVGQTDPVQVIEELQRKSDAAPNDTNLLENLGNACFDQGDSLRNEGNLEDAKTFFQRAIKAYQKVQTITPKASVQVDMATALYYSEQPDEAENAYKKAIEMDPEYLNARLNYGIFLFDVRKDLNSAKLQFNKAAQLKPPAAILDKISEMLRNIAAAAGQTPDAVLDYTKDVEPVIFQNCTSCHGPGGVMAKSPLHTYEYVKKYVIPKDSNSPLIKELNNPIHPSQQKPEVISLIENWILAGATGPK